MPISACDVAVVGAGPAGAAAAVTAVRAGARVVLVDPRPARRPVLAPRARDRARALRRRGPRARRPVARPRHAARARPRLRPSTHLPRTRVWRRRVARRRPGPALGRAGPVRDPPCTPSPGGGPRGPAPGRRGRCRGPRHRGARPACCLSPAGTCRACSRRAARRHCSRSTASRRAAGWWSPAPGRSCCRSPPAWPRPAPRCWGWSRRATRAAGLALARRRGSARTRSAEAHATPRCLARHRVPVHRARRWSPRTGGDRLDAVTVARLDRDWNGSPARERRLECDTLAVG